MTRTEHLLAILSEECDEVGQRAMKALRFGLTEVQPGQGKTNARRIVDELADLYAVFEMLREERALMEITDGAIAAKKAKVEQYLAYSAECGTLAELSSSVAEGKKP